jgi:RimJ/RimL family protein N-acetyltransferase
MREYVATALREQSAGVSLPFVIVDKAGDRIVGSTRYASIDGPNRRLEIGWTWLASSHQRTMANTEAKLLLLTHAFETLGMNRVEFKTDVLNERSRMAIKRLGAIEEGIFRQHVVTASGRVRDTIYFSIVAAEWPATKEKLAGMCR